MQYGFCTGFAVSPLFSVDETMESSVEFWGFDFIEYPLMSIAALNKEEFSALEKRVRNAGLLCSCACNLFPGSVPVIGENVREEKIREYLDTALARASRLGVKKLIFGSAGARHLGSFPKEDADRQFIRCLSILEEYCRYYGTEVLIEPIRRGEADYINTLEEGAQSVHAAQNAGCGHIRLMADLFHMESNGESLSDLEKYLPIIRHIHVCEQERLLPNQDFSPFLLDALHILKRNGYDQTISYESIRPQTEDEGKRVCRLLRKTI